MPNERDAHECVFFADEVSPEEIDKCRVKPHMTNAGGRWHLLRADGSREYV